MPFDNTFKVVLCTSIGVLALCAFTGLQWVFAQFGIDLFGKTIPLYDLPFDKLSLLMSIIFSSYFITTITDAILVAVTKRRTKLVK